MRIGRLHIETFDLFGDDTFYRDAINGDYYQLIKDIDFAGGDCWCRRYRQIWRGLWWGCDPKALERRNFYDLKPLLSYWTTAP